MNTRTIISLAMLAAFSAAALAVNPPYTSDLYIEGNLDAGWTKPENNPSRSKGWQWDNVERKFSAAGRSGGAVKPWDDTYAADTWLISPAITLKSGETYTVSLLAQTRGTSETENFEVKLAQGNTTADLSAGQQLTCKENFQSHDAYTEVTAVFSVSADGEYYAGIHCFSEANMYDLYVTAFSITGGNGGGTGGDDDDQTAFDLPWTADFSSAEGFSQWKSVAGTNAGVTSPWNLNSNRGYAEFSADGMMEDNWLISPVLNFPEAGTYTISMLATVYGDMDLALGDTTTDPDSFTEIIRTWENTADFDEQYTMTFDIAEAGTHRLGLHVHSASGSAMGYRLSEFDVRQLLELPVAVTDLAVMPDKDDALSATITWTNPSETNLGTPLSALSKAVVLRNGVEIGTVDDVVPGKPSSLIDATVPEAGIYTYSVQIYDSNGRTPDDMPAEVRSLYIGRPTADMPWEATLSYADDSAFDTWTPQGGWQKQENYGAKEWVSEVPAEGIADAWLSSPYLHLTVGYYRLTYNVNSRYTGYEVGIARNRIDPASSFTTIASVSNEQESGYNERTNILNIEEEGDYIIAWHHNQGSENAYYNTVKINRVSLVPQVMLPAVATELQAEYAADLSLKATVTWKNPDVDNAGQPLQSLTKAVILRDGAEIGTVYDIVPGKPSFYSDNEVPNAGEYTYTVEIYNANGKSEDDAPSVTLHIGPCQEIPYTADFYDWTVGDSYFDWKVQEDGSLSYSSSYGAITECAVSPYINFTEAGKYRLTMTVTGTDAPWDILTSNNSAIADMTTLASLSAPATTEETTVSVDFVTADEASMVDESNDEEEPTVSIGKRTFALRTAETGSIQVISFKIEKRSSSGMTTIAAANESITYADDKVRFPSGTTGITVCDLAGRTLLNLATADSIDLSPYSGILVISADIDGHRATLKVSR